MTANETDPGRADAFERRLVGAIHAGKAAPVADDALRDDALLPAERELATAAVAACDRIGRRVDAERSRVAEMLANAGVEIRGRLADGPTQRHEIKIHLERSAVQRAIEVLEQDGYRRQVPASDAAMASLMRVRSELAVSRSVDVTLVVRLIWNAKRRTSRLTQVFRPTPADWAMVNLPPWAWWAYSVVRPIRLTLERLGVRTRDHAALEPFLVTPTDLVDRLLDVAAVGPDDTVLDVGCGDGRIVLGAAQRHRCRAIGIEQSASLVAQAREQVQVAGLSDTVRIIHGDALAADVGHELVDVTVVILFLPMRVALRVVPALLNVLRPGARLVLHEQSPLPEGLPRPDRSVAIIGAESVSVAHRWDVVGAR